MKTSELLQRAHAEVTKGWTKNRYIDPEGNVCALGSLYRAAGRRFDVFGLPDLHDARKIDGAVDALHDHLVEFGFPDIPSFNDDEHTTQRDVLALFEKAIASCQERGE